MIVPFRRTIWTGQPVANYLDTIVSHVLWEGPRAGIGGVDVHWQIIEETVGGEPLVGLWFEDSNDGETWGEVAGLASGGTGSAVIDEEQSGFYRYWRTFDPQDYSVLLRVVAQCMVTGTPMPAQPQLITIEGGMHFTPEAT